MSRQALELATVDVGVHRNTVGKNTKGNESFIDRQLVSFALWPI